MDIYSARAEELVREYSVKFSTRDPKSIRGSDHVPVMKCPGYILSGVVHYICRYKFNTQADLAVTNKPSFTPTRKKKGKGFVTATKV